MQPQMMPALISAALGGGLEAVAHGGFDRLGWGELA